ncbi:GGDEF domain-containing protein [Bacillus toyonensis]|uniref:GGDEF domain-containing protein n=1 Tax=Bacillus toyonensis TaxID=155322 RepID=UPI002E202870|nr:GGDEF domain-containing protein [Bacillus toyonensis]
MEHLKILLKNNNIELGKFKEITDIFEMLGNQQESKNVFKKVNKFLEEIETDYSIWQYNRDKKIELLWYKGDKEQREAYENKQEIFSKVYKNKKPLGDYNDEGFYLMLPIVSREEVVGYFCLHKEVELGEKWSDVYIIVQLLGFTLKYYEMVETMKEMSVIDVITGLYNSRHFRLQIDLEAEKSKRFKKPLTLAVIKIKDFSEVNKKLGFEGGEEVLKNFGTILKLESRKTDMPSRISDEVFGILLYETNLDGAQKYIKRLENYLNEEPMVIDDYRFKIEMDVNLVEYSKNMSSEEFLEEGKNF